ncbi:MAG TPA: hypothetical protein VJ770_29510 [Stellaceae bacterium]|nr:hypothetical protein [Stellaceae bacterium]
MTDNKADSCVRGTVVAIGTMRPALVSIPDACRYLGDLSRSRLYELLPDLDKVKIGARNFVTIESLDRLITANRQPAKGSVPRTASPTMPDEECRPADHGTPQASGPHSEHSDAAPRKRHGSRKNSPSP